ncbi:hypothetical protein Y032_0125g1290 [Ancylostoma ceylanicum]|uniref:Uncharacterized protein n=1 Tax=Ancylostoma ceylanicum TaxID=53326 RepID=A0A016T936_9BILA|nr:hypothetical protein Y032_0125g1290 [Ancylostoma ceylanicum]
MLVCGPYVMNRMVHDNVSRRWQSNLQCSCIGALTQRCFPECKTASWVVRSVIESAHRIWLKKQSIFRIGADYQSISHNDLVLFASWFPGDHAWLKDAAISIPRMKAWNNGRCPRLHAPMLKSCASQGAKIVTIFEFAIRFFIL